MNRLPFAKLAVIATAMSLTAAPSFADDLTGEWHLVAINGLEAAAGTTLNFEADGKFNGKAPCNRYFGAASVDFPKITLSGIGATRMACDRLADELAYFDALNPVDEVKFLEDHLVLTGPEDRVLEYARDEADRICLSCGK